MRRTGCELMMDAANIAAVLARDFAVVQGAL